MAKYTTQIKSVVESGHPLFDFDYPIFDPAYKKVLEQKIINRYYFREIGFETVGQFKWFLKTKLNEIMPFYNEHYKALEVFRTYDPYKNKNVTTTDKRTSTANSSGESESKTIGTGTDTTIFSDTPQAKLQGLDYATNVTESDSGDTTTGTASSTGEAKAVEDYISTIAGHDGMKYPSDILKDLRATFINIDTMILDDLNELFMSVY